MPCNERLIAYKQGEDPDYEDYVVTDQGEVIRCTFDFQCEPTGVAHIPHWATCLHAKKHRQEKNKASQTN